MSRKAIALVLFGYFVAAVAAGFFIEMQKPFAKLEIMTSATALGAGFGLFVIAGILPLIFWAFGRFRKERAAGPLCAWAIIGIIVGFFSYKGTMFDQDLRVDTWTKQLNLSGKDRDDFVRNANQGCIRTQRQSALNQQIGIFEQQISAYCGCYADALTKVVTADDLRFFAMNGKPSAAMREKIDQILPTCSSAAVGR